MCLSTDQASTGLVKWYYQSRTLIQYACLCSWFDIFLQTWAAILPILLRQPMLRHARSVQYTTLTLWKRIRTVRQQRSCRSQELVRSIRKIYACFSGLSSLASYQRTTLLYHDVIDEFQTATIRYQLYEAVSDLGIYKNVYCPNFHGFLLQAQRNIIRILFTKKVMEWVSCAHIRHSPFSLTTWQVLELWVNGWQV
jgi:hypothetical protein